MKSAVERVKAAFEHRDQGSLVRGELWIGRRPFQELRIDDSLEGHIDLRNRLGMDLLFLSLADPEFSSSLMDYRRFSVAEIARAAQITDLFTGIIIDGPFQRLVEKQGLMPLLTSRPKLYELTPICMSLTSRVQSSSNSALRAWLARSPGTASRTLPGMGCRCGNSLGNGAIRNGDPSSSMENCFGRVS